MPLYKASEYIYRQLNAHQKAGAAVESEAMFDAKVGDVMREVLMNHMSRLPTKTIKGGKTVLEACRARFRDIFGFELKEDPKGM